MAKHADRFTKLIQCLAGLAYAPRFPDLATAHLALVVLLVQCGVVLLLLQLLKLRLLHMQLETCVRE
jgi:hypothetical protein